MEEGYIFKVSSREIKSYSQDFEENIVISISEAPSMYLFIKLNKSNGCIFVDKVSFKADKHDRFDGHIAGYLKGRFGILDPADINKALLDLEKVLNGEQESIEFYLEKWKNFAEQFKKWFYENLKNCLEKDLEINNLYFNLN